MNIKTTFRSHFNFKKNLKKKKKIFVKNIIIFILIIKKFLKKIKINTYLLKEKKKSINILRSPNRHKKFFHQVCSEYFSIKIFFYFVDYMEVYPHNIVFLKNRLSFFFKNFGSNTITRTKFVVVFNTNLKITTANCL